MTTSQTQEPKVEIFYRPVENAPGSSHAFLVYTDAAQQGQ